MAAVACDLTPVAKAIFIWQHYDPAVKADLYSSAIVTASQEVVIFDPIPLATSQLGFLREQGRFGGIVTTNINHHRAAAWYCAQFSTPIFAHRASLPDEESVSIISVAEGDKVVDQLEVIEIDGAAPGEIALYDPTNGGTLVIGDALINFAPYGFAFLPPKYCANKKQMQRSLRKLLDYNAERMLFAHGTPILSGATGRLRQLLDVDR